jgi:Domain of unknown function (DUF1942)
MDVTDGVIDSNRADVTKPRSSAAAGRLKITKFVISTIPDLYGDVRMGTGRWKAAGLHRRAIRVKFEKLAGVVAVTAAAFGMAAATVVPASAANNIKEYGQPESLNDVYGNPMITYTVQGLRPSSDAVFHNGRLYEAMVTNEGGIPVVPMFNARAESGQLYRVIGGGIPGKLYFDVVGDTPNSVVYSDGVQDLLVWVSPRPISSGAPDVAGETTDEIGGGGAPDGSSETGGDEAAPPVEAPAPFELTPAEVAEPGFNGGGHR